MREAPALAMPLEHSVPRSRPPATPKPRAPAARTRQKPPSVLRRAFARPGVTVAGAIFAAVMTGIVTNAVLFQKGQHPSPLFGTGATAGQQVQVPTPPRPERHAVEPPAPAPEPAPIQPAADAAPVPQALPHEKHAALPQHKAPAHPDAIGKLLADGSNHVLQGKPAPKVAEAKRAETAVKAHGSAPAHPTTASVRPVKKALASAAVPTQQ